jgi:hypothetical protein
MLSLIMISIRQKNIYMKMLIPFLITINELHFHIHDYSSFWIGVDTVIGQKKNFTCHTELNINWCIMKLEEVKIVAFLPFSWVKFCNKLGKSLGGWMQRNIWVSSVCWAKCYLGHYLDFNEFNIDCFINVSNEWFFNGHFCNSTIFLNFNGFYLNLAEHFES